MSTDEVKFEIARAVHTISQQEPIEGSKSIKWPIPPDEETSVVKMQPYKSIAGRLYAIEVYPKEPSPELTQRLGFMAIRRFVLFPDGEVVIDSGITVHADDPPREVQLKFLQAAEQNRGVNEQTYTDLLGIVRAGVLQFGQSTGGAPGSVQ